MKNIAVSKAGARLAQIFDSVVEEHLPVRLTGRNASAILVSWDDWRAIEETLYRVSLPKLGASASATRIKA
jgi:antitoxin YefM